jgi:hypothetical protein
MTLKLLIIYYSLVALIKAWVIKTKKNMGAINIPLHNFNNQLSDKDLSFIISSADFFVKICTPNTSRKCFFRSYIMASVLRKMGVPIKMNVGLYNLNRMGETAGHCWLTLKEIPFAEKNNPNEKYPIKMAVSTSEISYWVGL